METRVINRYVELYDVYIGRPSKWGNPFLPEGGTERARLMSIKLYREWIKDQHALLSTLCELKGKRLGCYCAPKPCHGDVLVELVEKHCGDKCPECGKPMTKGDADAAGICGDCYWRLHDQT